MPDTDQAATFLAARFSGAASDVAPLGAGVWSRAFAFRRASRPYVIRFGAHGDDFARDRLAARFAGPELPIPAVIELGEAFDGYYAIAERVYGGYIDDVDEAQMRGLLLAAFARHWRLRSTGWSACPFGKSRCRSGVWRGDVGDAGGYHR